MRFFMMFVYLALIIIGVSFAALNASTAEVNFYFKTWTMPLSVVITIALGIGMLIGFMVFLGRYWRLKAEHRRVKHQLRTLEKEIQHLHSIPLQG
jgi:putative membrane protein